MCSFLFQAEDGIRCLVRSRGLGDVYKRQLVAFAQRHGVPILEDDPYGELRFEGTPLPSLAALDDMGVVVHLGTFSKTCLLYTSDAADERSSVDLGGRRIIKKKKLQQRRSRKQTRHTGVLT